MNTILERIYPDKQVLARRQAAGLPVLAPWTDAFTAYLHEEMRMSFLHGHDHCALVTSCALIDFAVKNAIHFHSYVKANYEFKPDEWDKLDRLEFGQAINMAKRRGIVTKAEWKQLEWIRKEIRNVYMHGETPRWIKDKPATFVKGDLNTGEAEEVTCLVRDDIVVQRQVRIVADRYICDDVIRLVDKIVRKLVTGEVQVSEEWKRENGSKPTREQVDRVLDTMRQKGLSQGDLIVMNDYPDDTSSPGASSEIDG